MKRLLSLILILQLMLLTSCTQIDSLTDAVADIICNQRRELPSAA